MTNIGFQTKYTLKPT